MLEALEEGAKNTLSVAMACACAGIVIGVVTATGLGIVFTQFVVGLAQNALVLALILTALAGIVLGMGMPTTPAYIMMVALLVPALIHNLQATNPDIRTPEDLYAELLLDVEMTAVPLTSRIVLAHSSIQQFVHRILLNLEDALGISTEAAREWRWVHRYRVWEVNRRVFLYPENWIAPDASTPVDAVQISVDAR